MQKKRLIRELEDLASFLSLAEKNAHWQAEQEGGKTNFTLARFLDGKAEAYAIAFKKLDTILKEAKT